MENICFLCVLEDFACPEIYLKEKKPILRIVIVKFLRIVLPFPGSCSLVHPGTSVTHVASSSLVTFRVFNLVQ